MSADWFNYILLAFFFDTKCFEKPEVLNQMIQELLTNTKQTVLEFYPEWRCEGDSDKRVLDKFFKKFKFFKEDYYNTSKKLRKFLLDNDIDKLPWVTSALCPIRVQYFDLSKKIFSS